MLNHTMKQGIILLRHPSFIKQGHLVQHSPDTSAKFFQVELYLLVQVFLPCLPNIKDTCSATYISLRYFCPYTILFASSSTFSRAKLFVTDCWKIS